jgi:hypothetical protein
LLVRVSRIISCAAPPRRTDSLGPVVRVTRLKRAKAVAGENAKQLSDFVAGRSIRGFNLGLSRPRPSLVRAAGSLHSGRARRPWNCRAGHLVVKATVLDRCGIGLKTPLRTQRRHLVHCHFRVFPGVPRCVHSILFRTRTPSWMYSVVHAPGAGLPRRPRGFDDELPEAVQRYPGRSETGSAAPARP